ncbi:MAG: zinc-binding alcohol dehydrogenase family protein [Flavipsychrobacter sp.]|nr:zinc-binding alcohol dehydrogenase family protein [Flavipsychrobacter sp.]
MKAAVMYQKGEMPMYAEVNTPIIENENELLINVKACAIKHFDKRVAKGTHYSNSADTKNAKVIGGDGVGVLADGTRVYALGVSGMMAEQAIIEKDKMVVLPDGIDYATAAALPNGVIGAAMALRFRACMQAGDTVLINGATGFTGRLAVQIAKHYGAKKIIATGRNNESLKQLLILGADEIIHVDQSNEQFVAQVKAIHQKTPVDVIVDYLWGHSAELLFSSIKGTGSFTHRTRYVSVGSMTGDKMQLSAEVLRSVNLQLIGSGLGSWTKEEVRELFSVILPEMLQLAADGKLNIETTKVPLKEIDKLWETDVPGGQRLVVVI